MAFLNGHAEAMFNGSVGDGSNLSKPRTRDVMRPKMAGVSV